jgi:hypothetical protein
MQLERTEAARNERHTAREDLNLLDLLGGSNDAADAEFPTDGGPKKVDESEIKQRKRDIDPKLPIEFTNPYPSNY